MSTIDDYKLVNSLGRNQQHVVSPHGEKIAVVVKTYSGITAASLNPKLPKKLTHSKYETAEDVRRAFAKAHLKMGFPSKQRAWARINSSARNPIWYWLFGLVATIAIIWGWID
ncbi:hypothetical protein [Candidatus Rariloculus sp.]|uniref:hypothetical protein n=1 Tax=Candidatus Rariloculus sp. TaxID=3101265 RepID=UPI003D0B0176